MLLTGLLFILLPALPLSAGETVLGAYIFHRHGDRTTKAYKPTTLTALGAEQVWSSGSWYRANYVQGNAPSRIQGIAEQVAVPSQLSVTSPVDGVLQISAQAFLQGLYPPAGAISAQTLGNGSAIVAPLGGYQYIVIDSVSGAASGRGSEDSTWLQGASNCRGAVASSNDYFASPEYLETLLPWATFADEMARFAVATTEKWCDLCGNTTGACAVVASTPTEAPGTDDQVQVPGPVAGVALVALVIILGMGALVMGVVGLRLVKRGSLALTGKTEM